MFVVLVLRVVLSSNANNGAAQRTLNKQKLTRTIIPKKIQKTKNNDDDDAGYGCIIMSRHRFLTLSANLFSLTGNFDYNLVKKYTLRLTLLVFLLFEYIFMLLAGALKWNVNVRYVVAKALNILIKELNALWLYTALAFLAEKRITFFNISLNIFILHIPPFHYDSYLPANKKENELNFLFNKNYCISKKCLNRLRQI